MPARKKLAMFLGRAEKQRRGRGRARRAVFVRADEDNFPGTYEISEEDDDVKIAKAVRDVGKFHSEKVKRTKDFKSKHERRAIANLTAGEVVCTDLAIHYKTGAVEVVMLAGILPGEPGMVPKRVPGGRVVLVFRDIADVPPNNELMALLAEKVNGAAVVDDTEETDRAQREQSLKAQLDVEE